ncbi:hypothetical protein FRX31_008008 [Thalictrum thalictroides]|uniref:Uncharacterized protein n=1 Tax=Thalictrum thalictroides TaxID=46969 RepID=A0A7J6X0P7_THATH|nr:hypothetical protein FRX31_008008 [Thalictrum thalictroides]
MGDTLENGLQAMEDNQPGGIRQDTADRGGNTGFPQKARGSQGGDRGFEDGPGTAMLFVVIGTEGWELCMMLICVLSEAQNVWHSSQTSEVTISEVKACLFCGYYELE